jgi:hypothetical protein
VSPTSYLKPSTWGDVAREFLWRRSTRRAEPTAPTWPLGESDRTSIAIRWPSRYTWEPSRKWLEPLRAALAKLVPVEATDIPQPYAGLIIVRVSVGGRQWEVAIDFSDYPPVNDEATGRCALYFKMQYLREGYGRDHVIPGGFPTNDPSIYDYLPHLRRIRDERRFRYDVYGRFSLQYAEEVRRKALAMLAAQQRFSFEGSPKLVRYSRFLREAARSKVCIDLPGKGDFCFRLIDNLAIGSCIVSPRPRTELPEPLVDRHHIVYTKDDLSDLVDLCAYYLENDEEREGIGRKSREYFDKYLHRDQLASYYLYNMKRSF